ncbi:MAG: hypothetical protein MZV49_25725 [Rhodopseudomonas palustris]|nr:hypothetical protein [Rhodopseudomonas palustris]
MHLANTLLLFHLFPIMTGMLWQSAPCGGDIRRSSAECGIGCLDCRTKEPPEHLFRTGDAAVLCALSAKPAWAEIPACHGRLSLPPSLMAKPMLVTLPFLMLLLDYWPLGRFSVSG